MRYRGAQRPQGGPACASPHGAGRIQFGKCARQALAAEKANGRDVCTVGAHSRRIARRFRGAVVEVMDFDGWSERARWALVGERITARKRTQPGENST